MKVSNYHFSCYYANLGQFYRDRKKFFSTTFIGYFCAILLCFWYYGFDFLSRFRLETKESSIKLHGNRKGSNHIAFEFPVCPSRNTDCRRMLYFFRLSPRLKTYTSYTRICIVFELKSFCDSFPVCSFFQVGLQRFFKKVSNVNLIFVPKPCPCVGMFFFFSRALAQKPCLFLSANRAEGTALRSRTPIACAKPHIIVHDSPRSYMGNFH